MINVTFENVNALIKHAPLTLFLGGWDSRRKNGAFRLAGALTLELLAVAAQVGVTSASRIDPKGIISQAGRGRIQIEVSDGAITFSLSNEPDPKIKTRPSKCRATAGGMEADMGHYFKIGNEKISEFHIFDDSQKIAATMKAL